MLWPTSIYVSSALRCGRVSTRPYSATNNPRMKESYRKRLREHAILIWGHECVLPGCQCSTLIIGTYKPPAITLARQLDPLTIGSAYFTIGEVYCSPATVGWDRAPWFVSMDPATSQIQLCVECQSVPCTTKKLLEERIVGKAETTIQMISTSTV